MLPSFGAPIDFAALRTSIDESGFQLLSMEAQLIGNLSERRDQDGRLRPTIAVMASGQVFWIHTGESPSQRTAYADLQQRIEKGGDHAALLGEVFTSAGSQPALMLQNIWASTEGD